MQNAQCTMHNWDQPEADRWITPSTYIVTSDSE